MCNERHRWIGSVSAVATSASSLAFELDGVEGGLEEMDVAEVGVDHQHPVAPRRILIGTDQEGQGELIHHKIARSLKFVIIQSVEGGAWFGDVLGCGFSGNRSVILL